jgi:protein O-GlcNAc transferase
MPILSQLLRERFHPTVFLFVCLVSALACGRGEKLPELPEIPLEGFSPAVRVEIEKAYAGVRSQPRDAAANGHLGMVLHAHQQIATAEVCYRRAHQLQPEWFDWLYYLAVVQQLQGKNAAAIENLRRAVKLQPDYTAAYLRLADLLLAAGDLDESGRIYDRLVRERPSLAAAHYGLGRVHAARDDPAAAIRALRQACDLFPEFGSAHFALAAAYRQAGNAAQAELHSEAHLRARSSAPPREDPLEGRVLALDAGAQGYIQRGIRLEAEGRLRESAEAHERALEIDAALTEAHISLIALYARLGRPEDAERHYRQVVALNPNLASAHYSYGVLLFGLGRTAEAQDAFARAVEANPRHAEAHTNLGYVLLTKGQLQRAEQHFRQALESKPGHRLARFHLGRLLADRKDYRGAIDHFAAILEPDDEHTPAYTYALAGAFAGAGERARALEYAQIARRKAAALGQSELLASIDRDIQVLERAR